MTVPGTQRVLAFRGSTLVDLCAEIEEWLAEAGEGVVTRVDWAQVQSTHPDHRFQAVVIVEGIGISPVQERLPFREYLTQSELRAAGAGVTDSVTAKLPE